MIPITAIFIVGYGLIKKQKVYEQFIDGAKDGLGTVLSIIPTLIGLMIGVKVISASGLLLWIAKAIGKYTTHIGVPADVIPIIIVRFFSSNAANTLCLDLFERCGTDSYEGFLVSIIMSCTETIFYTLSVYATAAKVTKTTMDSCRSIYSNNGRSCCKRSYYEYGNIKKRSPWRMVYYTSGAPILYVKYPTNCSKLKK